MRPVSFPVLANLVYPKIIRSFPAETGKLFFTFDDGPEPNITPHVLDILDALNVKATFFCLGYKVEKHPNLFNEIFKRGHSTGNHGYSHINGWKCSLNTYKKNIELGNKIIHSKLFRPPYGKLTPWQYNWAKKHYKIIAWNIMTYDFNNQLHAHDCLKIINQNAKSGSIIVFHDTPQAAGNLIEVLPQAISTLKNIGYDFDKIKDL